MRKLKIILCFFFSFFTLVTIAQRKIIRTKVNGCGFIIPPKPLITKFQSVYEAKSIINNMLDSVKWKENFSIKEQNGINNAYATVIQNKRWIVYDNNFLENLDGYASTKWASISVLAHEMGHHYYNHVVSGQGSTVPTEIEADAFSGYAMNKLGASLEQSIAAMKALGTEKQTSTHPAKTDRINSITRGWNIAKNEVKNTGNGGAGNTGSGGVGNAGGGGVGNTGGGSAGTGGNGAGNTGTNTDPATDPSWIALSFQSTQNQTVQLSDDGRTYQAAEIKVGQSFVFKFEIYNYGWLKLPYYNGYRTFKLMHGKDYTIIYNRRNKNLTVVEVPE